MSLEDCPTEILVNIFKHLRKRDLLKLYGLSPRIDYALKFFEPLPSAGDALLQSYPTISKFDILNLLDQCGDLWCIAGAYCAYMDSRINIEPNCIQLFYFKEDPSCSNYMFTYTYMLYELQIIKVVGSSKPTLSDFIAEVLYSISHTINSIAYNYETDDFVTVDRPAYYLPPPIRHIFKLQETTFLEYHLLVEMTKLIVYKKRDSKPNWRKFTIFDEKKCLSHFYDKFKLFVMDVEKVNAGYYKELLARFYNIFIFGTYNPCFTQELEIYICICL